jgi:[CysO sulfur-carrier protein]-S-L-cysteine hydrolase
MANAYDKYKKVRPDEYPRDSRTAYTFDGKEQLLLSRELDQSGETLSCIFHSHCDVGSYFSAEDKAMAAPDGVVLHPGVSYLVVAVDEGVATAANLFWWDAGHWRQAPVKLG